MKLFKDDTKFVAQDRLQLRNSLRESRILVASHVYLHPSVCLTESVGRVRSLDCYEPQPSSTHSHRDDYTCLKIPWNMSGLVPESENEIN